MPSRYTHLLLGMLLARFRPEALCMGFVGVAVEGQAEGERRICCEGKQQGAEID